MRSTLATQALRPGDIDVMLADDRALRALNRRYRGLDRATDVLSFAYSPAEREDGRRPSGRLRRASSAAATEARGPLRSSLAARAPRLAGGAAPSPRSPISGDLAISLERVSEQARRFRCTPGEELARLVVHGALHLAGLDHKTAPERRAMRALEDRIMKGARAEIGAFDRGMGHPARTRRP